MQFVPSSSLVVYPHLFLTSIPAFSLVAKSTGSASKRLMRKKRYINRHIQYTDRILSVGSRDVAIKQGVFDLEVVVILVIFFLQF